MRQSPPYSAGFTPALSSRLVPFFAALLSLVCCGRMVAQPQSPLAPGTLDRVVIVTENSGGSSPASRLTNVVAATDLIHIADSAFVLTGQSMLHQNPPDAPRQPVLSGSLSFNFPTTLPERGESGVFKTPLPVSARFQGTWTKAAGGESYSAGEIVFYPFFPGPCAVQPANRVKTGAPIAVGAHQVSASASCDLTVLSSLLGNDPMEREEFFSGIFQAGAGDGGSGANPVDIKTRLIVSFYPIYKSRRRPEISLRGDAVVINHTDGQPLPPPSTVMFTNVGGLPLNWTTTAETLPPGGSWLKLIPPSGTLASLDKQPLGVSVDPAGLNPGVYRATVTVGGNTWDGGRIFQVIFTYTGAPTISLEPSVVELFNVVAFPEQELTLRNTGTAPFSYTTTVTSEGGWMSIDSVGGSLGPGLQLRFRVSADETPPPAGAQLAPGDYLGQVLFRFTHGNPPVELPSQAILGTFHVLPREDELLIEEGSVVPSILEEIELNREYTNFRADVTYQLRSKRDADLALRLFDEQGILQASSDFVRVKPEDGRVTSKRLTIPRVKITPDNEGVAPEKLFLRAVLIDRVLQTPLKSTPEDEYEYPVQSAIKLTLGFGSNLATFKERLPALVRGHGGTLELYQDWPTAAVVDFPASRSPRALLIAMQMFSSSPTRLNQFQTRRLLIDPDFEGRVFVTLLEPMLENLPWSPHEHLAEFAQFRAILVNAEVLNSSESQQIDLPIERITVVATDPPLGSDLPRGQPVKLTVTTDYNVPVAGLRRVFLKTGGSTCAPDGGTLVMEGVLGPGRGRLTNELTVDFSKESGDLSFLPLSARLEAPGVPEQSVHCRNMYFSIKDSLALPKPPAPVVVAGRVEVQVVNNPTPVKVDVKSPPKDLAAVAGGNPGAGALAARKERPTVRLHADAPVALNLTDVITLGRVWQFAPSIPPGAGFSADLTLLYSSDDLPDDPNFAENAMQLISLNPATGELRTYATAVNAAARKATARVDSLESYYTLGIIGPFAKRVLNLPLLDTAPDLSSRLIVNAGNVGTPVELTAITSLGSPVADDGVINPLDFSLNTAATYSKLVPEAFNLLLDSSDYWMQGTAAASAVALLLLNGADVSEVVGAAPQPFPTLLIPALEYGADQTTELRIANPTRFANRVVLELHDDAGGIVGGFERVLDPKASLAGFVDELFPGLAPGFLGYLILRGDHDVLASALIRSAGALSAVAGQPLDGIAPPRLVAPGFTTGGANHRARLALVNTSAGSRSVTFRAIGDNGLDLASPVDVTITAGQQYRAEVDGIFGLNPATAAEGTLLVTGALNGLAGELTALDGSTAASFRTSSRLLTGDATRHAFAYFDQGAGRFTEFALFNPGAAPALMEIRAFRGDGTSLGLAPVTIPAGGRMNRRLAELVAGSAGVTGGSFVIESTRPIFASALVGEGSVNSLAAIPAHVGEAVSPPKDPGPLKADYRFQQNLVSSIPGAPDLIELEPGPQNTFAQETVDGMPQTVWRFPRGSGLLMEGLSALVPSNTWTMAVLFRFGAVGGYQRVIDLWNFTSDYGLYLKDGVPYYYNEAFPGIPFIPADKWTQFVLTRATDETLTGYTDGVLTFQFKDVNGKALPHGGDNLVLFQDNNGEHGGPGAIARFRLYERALTAAEVAALDRLDLPDGPFALKASWVGSSIVLTWPEEALGYVLQAKSILDASQTWSTVQVDPELIDGRKTVTLPLGDGIRFFRLAR